MAAPQQNFWTDTPGYTSVLPTKTQPQQNTLNNILKVGNEQLANTNTNFKDFAANARRDFASQSLPALAARATTGGAPLNSSGFQGVVSGAQADFESKLKALELGYNERQQDRTQNLLNMGLNTNAFENIYHPAQEGFGKAIAPGVSYAATAALAPIVGEGLKAAGTAAWAPIAGKIAAAGGIGAVITNPWVWGPVLAAAGLYLAYKGGKWLLDKRDPNDPSQASGIQMPQGQQQMTQQQQQPQQGGNFQQMQAPNFALGGAA